MNKRITIIGGMGPQASLLLHRRIIEQATTLGSADDGQVGFPEIMHFSIAVPDFISEPSKKQAALEVLEDRLSRFYLWRQRPDSYCL